MDRDDYKIVLLLTVLSKFRMDKMHHSFHRFGIKCPLQ